MGIGAEEPMCVGQIVTTVGESLHGRSQKKRAPFRYNPVFSRMGLSKLLGVEMKCMLDGHVETGRYRL